MVVKGNKPYHFTLLLSFMVVWALFSLFATTTTTIAITTEKNEKE